MAAHLPIGCMCLVPTTDGPFVVKRHVPVDGRSNNVEPCHHPTALVGWPACAHRDVLLGCPFGPSELAIEPTASVAAEGLWLTLPAAQHGTSLPLAIRGAHSHPADMSSPRPLQSAPLSSSAASCWPAVEPRRLFPSITDTARAAGQ